MNGTESLVLPSLDRYISVLSFRIAHIRHRNCCFPNPVWATSGKLLPSHKTSVFPMGCDQKCNSWLL